MRAHLFEPLRRLLVAGIVPGACLRRKERQALHRQHPRIDGDRDVCRWLLLVHRVRFRQGDGVISTTSGYIGGRTANPTYDSVSAGNSGHAEAVQVVFDPSKVTYSKLVEYLLAHDRPNDEGPSVLRLR